MTRYRHYLQPTTRHTFPSTIICVDCVSAVDVVTKTARQQTEELVSWNTVHVSRKDGKYGFVSAASGKTSASWWKHLTESLAISPSVWVVSNRCCRVWTLLGLWEQLEDERWTLAGSDNRMEEVQRNVVLRLRRSSVDPLRQPSASAVQSMLDRDTGYLCLEDVPNIARLRPFGCERFALWIDIRNYGVDVPCDVANGSRVAMWCASTMQRITSALYSCNLGSLKPTTGAQALGGFKHGYLRSAIYTHCDERSLATEGRGYYGGRCECYRIGTIPSPVYHADFRSAYGAIQRDCLAPVRLRGRISTPSAQEAERLVSRYGTIATVAIETNEEAYPYRRRRCDAKGTSDATSRETTVADGVDTDIIFPVGRFVTTLCGPELQDAMERGRVKAWHELCYYDCEPALRDYANAVYACRCEAESKSDNEIATLAKRLLVSLPGKFGQRDRRWVYCPDMSTDQSYGEWYGSDRTGKPCRYRAIAGKVFRDELRGWSADACPAIAAWITSAARVKLLQAIRCAGWEHTYYVDTDSVMVDGSGLTRLESAGLIRPQTMGYLELRDTSESTVIYGVKHYVESGKLVCAGLPKGQCEDAGDGLHYWYRMGALEQARKGQRPEATRVLRVYDRGGQYRHRLVDTDGWTTPHRLAEW